MKTRPPASIRLPRARKVAIDDPDAYSPGTALHRLSSKLRKRQLQQQALTAYLPHSLRDHIQIGEYQNGELCLLFTSAAWMTRARYEQHVLLESLRQHPDFASLQKIRMQIVPR